MSNEKLKPCPFCGSADVEVQESGSQYLACCVGNDNCGANTDYCYSHEEAVERWNNRKETDLYPVFDRLQDRLEQGCEIKKEDGRWCLFEDNGESVCTGKSIKELMANLIFTDC